MSLKIPKFFGNLVCGFLLLMLAGCSATLPSESMARSSFEQLLRSKLATTPFDIQTFSKANGQEFELAGVKGYRLFYTAMVNFPEGFHPECVQQGNNFVGFNCVLQFNGSSIRPQPRGAASPFSGEVDFQKTDNGWVPTAVS